MHKPRIAALGLIGMLIFAPMSSLGSDFYEDIEQFIKANPDGNKYEFVKTFITSLTYLKSNEERESQEIILDSHILDNAEGIGALMDGLTLDSVNWRISRNLIKRYHDPENGLMLKVSNLFMKMSEEQIEINSRERFILGELYEAQISGDIYNFDSYKFFKEIKSLSDQRKESFKKLLEAAILVTKVLVSNQMNAYGELESLGVSDEQRDKLIYKLDEFYGNEFEGEMREGQSFLQASISELKEFLSDYSWKTLDVANPKFDNKRCLVL